MIGQGSEKMNDLPHHVTTVTTNKAKTITSSNWPMEHHVTLIKWSNWSVNGSHRLHNWCLGEGCGVWSVYMATLISLAGCCKCWPLIGSLQVTWLEDLSLSYGCWVTLDSTDSNRVNLLPQNYPNLPALISYTRKSLHMDIRGGIIRLVA